MPAAAEGTRLRRELDRHIQAESPPVWIPAFAGMTVVQRCRRSGRAFGRRNDAVSADGRRGRFPRKMSQIAPNCTDPALDGPNGGTGLILIQRTFEADPDGGEARVDAFSGCDSARASGLGVLGGYHGRHCTNVRSFCQEASGIAALARELQPFAFGVVMRHPCSPRP